MAHATIFRRLLALLAIAGCAVCVCPALAVEDPAGANPAAGAPDADAPAVTLTLREGSTTVFADSEISLHVGLRAEAAVTGNLVWQHTADSRTLSAGEIAVAGNEPLAFKLRIPAIKEGISFPTQLTLSLIDKQAKPQKQTPQATLTHTLWIVDPDPFAGRQQWLKDLKLALYDPPGDTARVFEHAKIPVVKVSTLGALDQLESGIVLIGEGIDLTRAGKLGDSIFRLAERGVPVLCLAPASGELPYPTGVAAVALRFDRDPIVSQLDKRLSAAAWPASGETAAKGFLPATVHGDVVLRVSRDPLAWPWIEMSYVEKTKLILCGYPIVATWEREATARYLLAQILQNLDRPKETVAVESKH